MKTMYNNEALESYLQFVNRVVKNGDNEETKKQYDKFLANYKNFTEEKEQILFDIDALSKCGMLNIEIHYSQIEQIWAYIHFCLNIIIEYNDYKGDNNNLPTSFVDFSFEDFNNFQDALSMLWYLPNRKAYVIVEDIYAPEDVDDVEKLVPVTKILERNKIVAEKNAWLLDSLSEDELNEIKQEQFDAFIKKLGNTIKELSKALNIL